jgi:hypothetical protein
MHPSSAEALAVVEIGTILHEPIDRCTEQVEIPWRPTRVENGTIVASETVTRRWNVPVAAEGCPPVGMHGPPPDGATVLLAVGDGDPLAWWFPTETSRLGSIGLVIVRSIEARTCFSPPPLPEGDAPVRFTAAFTVDATGVASGFSLMERPGSALEACLATTLGRLRYPPGNGPVSIRWPMVLTPPRG